MLIIHFQVHTLHTYAQDDETTSEQPVCDFENVNKTLSGIQHLLMDTLSVCNNTEGKKNSYMQKLTLVHSYFHKFANKSYIDIVAQQVGEVLDSYKRAQSQELREIISEMSSGQLPLGTFLNPAPSCKHLPDNSSSGNYWIQNTGTGYASLEYCDMTRRCCNSSGGWMRVAHLDMIDHTHHCPIEFREITTPKRTCARSGNGCRSTTYPVDGISYSRICGKIKAYQYSSMDAFNAYYDDRAITIDDVYVDGVSLTHGKKPRKHIWSFANALDETQNNYWVCPCTKTVTPYTGAVPPFIGEDYFCETGSRYQYQVQFYSEDPLWDGAGCGGTSTCCQFNNPPWFCKHLPQPTTDDIELRLCSDEAFSIEDTAIEQVELYI